jgi:hypothetical protein
MRSIPLPILDWWKWSRIAAALSAFAFIPISPQVIAQHPRARLPKIFATDKGGMRIPVPDRELCNVELELREQFARSDAPDEVFVMVRERPGHISLPAYGLPVELLKISVFHDKAELRWYDSDTTERYFFREISAEELAAIRKFVSDEGIDRLPELPGGWRLPNGMFHGTPTGGSEWVYLHMNAHTGFRVVMDHPDREEGPPGYAMERYAKVVDFFSKLWADQEKLQVRYDFPRPIDGFEVLFARRELEVLDVWKQGETICLTVKNRWPYEAPSKNYALRDNKLADEVEPRKDRLPTTAEAGDTKLRLVRTSADGRWVVGNRRDNGQLACYDRSQKKFVPIADEDVRVHGFPVYYLDTHHVFLLASFDAVETARIIREGFFPHLQSNLRVLDPATGQVSPYQDLTDDYSFLGPLFFQELPSRLQPVRGKDHQAWAAIPKEASTSVCVVDTRELRMISGETIPNIRFNTKQMWVDEAAKRVYIVYKRQLVSLPLMLGAD